jgi:site-specific DNA recombinase
MRGRQNVHNLDTNRKCLGYIRVSTEEQARAGVSLEAQEARIRAFALATGRDLADLVVDDGQSAKSLYRPGLKQILDRVSGGEVDSVIVLKLDRLTRSVRDLGQLLDLFTRHDTALVSVSESLDTQSAAGRLMVNVLGSVAQWEREAISERTAFALAHKRQNRRAYSRTPFGYERKGDALVRHPQQQRVLALMKQMAARGASLRQIACELTHKRISPPRGRAWHASGVRSILKSKISSGL